MLRFTRSRRSLPGLKCGTYLPAKPTDSPVFGLRPIRGARKCSEKLPNPRISMRSPWAEGLRQLLDHELHRKLHILAGELALFRGDALYEFRFSHISMAVGGDQRRLAGAGCP